MPQSPKQAAKRTTKRGRVQHVERWSRPFSQGATTTLHNCLVLQIVVGETVNKRQGDSRIQALMRLEVPQNTEPPPP